jgi:hypothetical protein
MYIVITGKIAIVINKPFNTFGHAPIKTEYSEIDYKRFGCKVNEVTCGEGFGEKVICILFKVRLFLLRLKDKL